ncbi:response regulator [Singulisphaera sp. PoT]|uniref:response regulator n=1 Tax=Singulisphaera sp. PoT TaxID=3411797 RepID=UPI003BF5FCBD
MVKDEKVNILIVDDLSDKIMALEAILDGLGQNIITARSGREALRRLLEREYAVILLDVNMPDIDGFETAAMIRSRRQTLHTPIIFITAFSDEMHTAQGYSLGAVDYILSPVVPEILRTKVGVFVDLYRKTQQVKQQAEERVALAHEQAARAAAEEATRKSSFLAEASTALVRSLDYDSIPQVLAMQTVPFIGDLCVVTLVGEDLQVDQRTELAWAAPGEDVACRSLARGEAPISPLDTLIESVLKAGASELVATCDPSNFPARRERNGKAPIPPGPEAAAFATKPQSVMVVPLRARGRILGTIAVVRFDASRLFAPPDLALLEDLADRAAFAIDNARLYRDIQENDRRKNEFLAMLAHELRNPLAPIRNAVQILRMLDLNDPELLWANDIISRQVEQMVRLVDDLLDISRITGGKIQLRMEPIDVTAAINRAVETSRPLIDARRHDLAVAVPQEPLKVVADVVRLSQVLSNLLNNSAKYTKEGGRITLEVTRQGDEAVFFVRDNGIGISGEMLSSIFDLFTQLDRSLDRSQGGLGIGLTLVRQLVEMHGGTVQASSAGEDQGSEFIIRLPALPLMHASVEADVNAPEDASLSTPRRILIVDDNPDVANSLARLLRMRSHEVRTAEHGEAALSELVNFQPQTILLDIGLPGMDGYEVAQAIRKLPTGESVVLVALTGYGQDEDRRRSQEAGFDHHLVKPVELASLLSLISLTRNDSGESWQNPSLVTRS